MQKLLWEELNLSKDFNCNEIDDAYERMENKTPRVILAWKILRDSYYSEVYREYMDEEIVVKAGFMLDTLKYDEIDYYDINFLTTPFDKLKDDINEIDNPIVLLSTGGFYPIHDGHIKMMNEAKKVLEEDGYDVLGGYFSLSHENYISTKPYYTKNQYERINDCREYLKDNNWLMVDPWESIYVRTTINFTNVIERLELYLQKHISEKIKVAYVFGGDNVEFMYCFKKKGIGICINRNGYDKLFNQTQKIKNDNMYFIDNSDNTSMFSSRDIRKNEMPLFDTYDDVGNYLIRNEELLPLEKYINNQNRDRVKQIHEKFLNKFVDIFSNCFDNKISIKVIDMNNQLKKASKILERKNTINLDSYFNGTYNLEVSRLFNISSYQDKYIRLIGRLGHESISEQVSKIKPGEYILVDDDSVTGRTLKSVINCLPDDVKILKQYLLANSITDKVFDVVDLRDFIVGSLNSGLVVKLPNEDCIRVPYVMPYVNLTTRASISPSKEREFSIDVWKLNREFYEELDKNIKLKDTDENFCKLMKYIGFDEDDLVIDICEWHINKLSK